MAAATLVLERRAQRETPVYGGVLMMTPAIDEDYWSYRVRLTESEAIVGFPKFGSTGIGYASEEDWNLNFPWTFDADEIASHIARNKGDDSIPDPDVLAAIRLIQEAILEDDPTAAEHLARVRERRAGR